MKLIEFIKSENVAFFFFLYFGAAGKRTQPVQRVSLALFSYFPAQRANGHNWLNGLAFRLQPFAVRR